MTRDLETSARHTDDRPATSGTHEALPDERNKDVFVYVNGEFFHRDEAKISVFDSGYLVGDGVWEGIRLFEGKFVFLDRHLDRLFQGAKTVDLNIGKSRAELTEALYATVRRNDMHTDVHARLMVTRGNKKTPAQDPRLTVGTPNIVIIAEHKVADPAVTTQGHSAVYVYGAATPAANLRRQTELPQQTARGYSAHPGPPRGRGRSADVGRERLCCDLQRDKLFYRHAWGGVDLHGAALLERRHAAAGARAVPGQRRSGV